MAISIPKGTRLMAEVDLGGIGVAAGEEFVVDDCNEHLDYAALLATGAVVAVKTAKAMKPAEVAPPADTTKAADVKPPAGGADGR